MFDDRLDRNVMIDRALPLFCGGPHREDVMDYERHIIALEEIVGLQGKTIDDLSDVIAEQQKQIDKNERMLKAVANKLHAMYDNGMSADSPPDEAPPHY